jgi:hypothetical protein
MAGIQLARHRACRNRFLRMPSTSSRRPLCLLLTRTGLRLETQKALPLVFEGVRIDCAYRADLFVEALDALAPVHLRQRRLSTIFAPPILAIECQSPPPSLRPHQAQHPWLIT